MVNFFLTTPYHVARGLHGSWRPNLLRQNSVKTLTLKSIGSQGIGTKVAESHDARYPKLILDTVLMLLTNLKKREDFQHLSFVTFFHGHSRGRFSWLETTLAEVVLHKMRVFADFCPLSSIGGGHQRWPENQTFYELFYQLFYHRHLDFEILADLLLKLGALNRSFEILKYHSARHHYIWSFSKYSTSGITIQPCTLFRKHTIMGDKGLFKKKCQLSCSSVFCWSLLLFYSDMVHKQWLKMWFLTS